MRLNQDFPNRVMNSGIEYGLDTLCFSSLYVHLEDGDRLAQIAQELRQVNHFDVKAASSLMLGRSHER